uniref:Uncharacterized protein n=1 Tax=Rhizophora mucronata TaxID=61149 RepID=A0A2P2PTH1_RHIMU
MYIKDTLINFQFKFLFFYFIFKLFRFVGNLSPRLGCSLNFGV